jgi:putative endonuclease
MGGRSEAREGSSRFSGKKIYKLLGASLLNMRQYCVYIMTNHSGTLYIGVTNNLKRRVWEHKNKVLEGFTKKYKIDQLVHYEQTEDVVSAIAREKQLKGWTRKKKIALIEKGNPFWRDLYDEL